MARATTKTTATTKAASRPSAAAAPKKKIGRPPGSKNRVPAAATTRTAAARRTPAATPAVRMNKAELEAHVVKLERSLARAKTQTADLKRALKEASQPAATANPRRAPAAAKAKYKNDVPPAKRARRSKAEVAAAEQAQDTDGHDNVE